MQSSQEFDDKYCADCTRALESCAVTREYLRKCADCGLDVSNEQAANGRQEAFLSKFKENFFPGQP